MFKQTDLKLKFYADTPSGQKNKLFVFKVKSYDHAIDLAAWFVQEYNFNIRAAYFQIRRCVAMKYYRHRLRMAINMNIQEQNGK